MHVRNRFIPRYFASSSFMLLNVHRNHTRLIMDGAEEGWGGGGGGGEGGGWSGTYE